MPHKRTMILRSVDVYNFQDGKSSSESENDYKNKSEDIHPCEQGLLMIWKTLHNLLSPQELTQRENIFHTTCKVLENTCSLIIQWLVLQML